MSKVAVKKFFTKITTAFWAIFDGIVATFQKASNDPVQLAKFLIIGFLVADLIFGGKLGFIVFVVAQIKALVAIIGTLKTATLVFLAFIATIWYTKQ